MALSADRARRGRAQAVAWCLPMRRLIRRLGDAELLQQVQDPLLDLVADGSDRRDVLPGWVLEHPLLVLLPGEDRAGVATAHRDDRVGGLDDLVGPRFGELTRDVDALLGHGSDRDLADLGTGLGAPRPGDRIVRGVVGEEAEGHLRAAG